MPDILKALTNIVSSAFAECGYDEKSGIVTPSDRLDLCQFQCNGAFAASKIYKKPPFVIAEEVAAVVARHELFESAELCKPGFINMTLKDEALLKLASDSANDAHLGIPQEKAETVILDYGGANVAKPLHIGHLRSAIIGESLKRIAQTMGLKVVGDVHMGDWGLQIGLVIAELRERNPDWACFSDGFNTGDKLSVALNVDELNEIYPTASKKSKEHEQFKETARRITAELQSGHAGYMALWREIMHVSVEDLRKNYGALGIEFELWLGESDAEQYVPELLNILTEKNLLIESQGAMVVDVSDPDDKAEMPPVIIKKSDNSSIYATTDLATIIQRQRDFAPGKIWYVVDKRQSLHFTQVFRCAKKAGLVPEGTELEHAGFGTMNGSDGKPYKTRDGGVMRLDDFMNQITEAAYDKMNAREFENEGQKLDTAKKVAVAAIKFGDLSNHRLKDYVFDIDKFLSFEGKTGTYLLYTVTRINSILKKVGYESETPEFTGIYSGIEREIYLYSILMGETFRHAVEEKAPSFICDGAYRLAQLFSQFYHDNRISNEQDEAKKTSWLSLCIFVRKMLVKHLDALGIETVEVM